MGEGSPKAIHSLCLVDGMMVTGAADKLIRVIELESGAVKWTMKGHSGTVSCLEKRKDLATNEVREIKKKNCLFIFS